jgi:hypothetical protein
MKTNIKQIAAGTFIALLFLVGNAKASCLESNEANLQLESWMTDYSIWDVKYNNIADYGQEMEEALIVEDWMTNAETWNSDFNFVEVTEENLELEGWMIDNERWNKNSVNESALALEPWMTNKNLWK